MKVFLENVISIPSPRMGRDVTDIDFKILLQISIHSPRMGRDEAYNILGEVLKYFNPLSPHGERHGGLGLLLTMAVFQSTLPAWGETYT